MGHAIGMIHEEDGVFGIRFPDFPGCISGGASLDEAIARGAATLAFHVEGMIEDGDLLPNLRSAGDIQASGETVIDGAVLVAIPVRLPGRAIRLNVSLDERLVEAIDRVATSSGLSRSAFLAEAARAKLRKGL